MEHSSASSTASPRLDSLLSRSLQIMERPTSCCCGREHCAYLKYNIAAIEGLEKDLKGAAQIGQVGSGFLANRRRIVVVILCFNKGLPQQ